MLTNFDELILSLDKDDAFKFASETYLHLTNSDPLGDEANCQEIWYKLTRLIHELCKTQSGEGETKGKSKDANSSESIKQKMSLNLIKLLSRDIVIVLEKLPNKIYDTANDLFPYLEVNDLGELSIPGKAASVVLIDLFENYPHHLTSLLNFGATVAYKLLKKCNSTNIIYLLSTVLKNALKSDIDEKMQAKLTKHLLKSILVSTISSNASTLDSNTSSILQVEYYIEALKNISILLSASHYEQLLEFSASTSSGSKLKPEAIMTQQHQFQSNMLNTQKKIFQFGFASEFPQIRSATAQFLAHLLHNFVDTGKFTAIDYIVESYPLPVVGLLNNEASHTLEIDGEIITSLREEQNVISVHNSEGIIDAALSFRNIQSGYIESLVMYLQLQQFQEWSFLSNKVCSIFDTILLKFAALNNSENAPNSEWSIVLSHWKIVIDFLLKESGAPVHELVAQYIVHRFSTTAGQFLRADSQTIHATQGKKQDSKIFGFKSTKKSKTKGDGSISINPYTNPYQLSLLLVVVDYLVPYAIDFNSLDDQTLALKNEDGDSAHINDDEKSDSADDDEAVPSKGNDYICELLVSLLVNKLEQTRNHATSSLLHYASINKSQSNSLILRLFHSVTLELSNSESQRDASSTERNVSPYVLTRLLSNSLALLSLLKQADSTILQNSTIAKILSFCTQNLKHGGNTSKRFLSNAACWIIMASLVTFSETSEFVKLNSSQFLVFWKNLLTSQLVSADLGSTSDASHVNEIMNNLMLRSLSLLCLHNYIDSIASTADIPSQLQFLLVKSYNYLTYLESTFEDVGAITAFNSHSFNESNFNPNSIGNLIFSTYHTSKLLPAKHRLASLILYNKKVVLQGFIKLAPTLKRDVNSSLVVFLTRVFADVKCFSRLLTNDPSKERSKLRKHKGALHRAAHRNHTLIKLQDDYNYEFGVTSKFASLGCPDEMSLTKDSINTNLHSSSKWEPTFLSWPSWFEQRVMQGSVFAYNQDPASFLLTGTRDQTYCAKSILRSIVDFSIELFQYVFPNLTFKIQFSLLEQLRSSLSQKTVDPMRKLAIQVNDTIALNGLLRYISKSKSIVDSEILDAILTTVETINFSNILLDNFNAETVGMVCKMLPNDDVERIIARYINEIVSQTDPLVRGRKLLFLSAIFKHSHRGFADVLDVILQLMRDPNPVMAYYSSSAAVVLLENSLGNSYLVKQLISLIHCNILNDSFGLHFENELMENQRLCYHVQANYSKIMCFGITSLGPALKSCDDNLKQAFTDLLVYFANGIGNCDSDECVNVTKDVLSAFQQILIFDSSFTPRFSAWFHRQAVDVIKANMKLGIGVVSPTFPSAESIFPVSTSIELYDLGFSSILEMTKVGIPTLNKENVNLAWIAMEINPTNSLMELIDYWVDSHPEKDWFSQVNALFKLSAKRLTGPFLEQTYQLKLLPLTQRRKKKNSNSIDMKDDEVKNIVNEDADTEDKNEPITWEFRLFLYDVMIHIMNAARRNSKLASSLTSKIQEIVRMSFLGTTSPITAIQLKGIELLDSTLSLFGQLQDPLYPGISILEQQQAQIISAVVPCFGPHSNTEVIVNAISVSSKFMNLPRIKFYSKQRILKTLVCLLEEISSNKFIKFTYLEAMSEFNRKAIQLSILNCWAVVKINFEESTQEANEQFASILTKYSDLLVSLWILALKDLSTLRYCQPSSKEIPLYGDCWLNFVEVLTIELELNSTKITELLQDDSSDFFFVLFCQCAEALIKSLDTPRVLLSMKRLVSIPTLVSSLIADDIFGEVIDLLDRLILVEEPTEAKIEVIEIALTLSRGCVKEVDGLDSSTKLFELLRIAMLPLFSNFPFLRDDYDPEEITHQMTLKKCNSASSLLILRKLLSAVVQMLSNFDGQSKASLCSCLFYLFAKFYEHNDDNLIGVILPYLKLVMNELGKDKSTVLSSFFTLLKSQGFFDTSKGRNNQVITIILLITNSDITLDEQEAEYLANAILGLILDTEFASAGVLAVKSLLKDTKSPLESSVVRNLMLKMVKQLANGDEKSTVDPLLAFEIVCVFSVSDSIQSDLERAVSLYAMLLPLFVKHDNAGIVNEDYLHGKTVLLLNRNPEAFKRVVNEYLDEEQKKHTESLVKKTRSHNQVSDANDSTIELKTFG